MSIGYRRIHPSQENEVRPMEANNIEWGSNCGSVLSTYQLYTVRINYAMPDKVNMLANAKIKSIKPHMNKFVLSAG